MAIIHEIRAALRAQPGGRIASTLANTVHSRNVQHYTEGAGPCVRRSARPPDHRRPDVVGLPGVQTYGLFDALANASNLIRLTNARHEQTTACMALGYARAPGRPAAYAVVPAPGVLNTTAGVTPRDPPHPNPIPDPGKIAARAKLLDGAKAPMLWIGGGALHAPAEVRALHALTIAVAARRDPGRLDAIRQGEGARPGQRIGGRLFCHKHYLLR